MIRKVSQDDYLALYEMVTEPTVFSFVRQKPNSYDEFVFFSMQNEEKEHHGEMISRVITTEFNQPIGMISLYDIQHGHGFLGTWIGNDFQGKGYNRIAKDLFFDECFSFYSVDKIYMKVRKVNEKSKRAALKLPYVKECNEFEATYILGNDHHIFDLFSVEKDTFSMHFPLSEFTKEA
jgi:RimJ/RimL family protein N-acetyltransferase